MDKKRTDSPQNEGMVMRFHLGEINHPTYGKADNMTGEIQFVLPSGVYRYPTIVNEPARFEKVVSAALPACRELWPDLLDEEILTKLQQLIYATSLVTKIDLCEERGMSILFAFILAFTMDDLFDLGEFSPEITTKEKHNDAKGFVEIMQMTNLWDPDNFSENTPSWSTEIEFIKNFLLKAEPCVRSLDTRIGSHEKNELFKTSYAYVILKDLKNSGLEFSYATSMYFDRYVHGVRPLLERIALCEDVTLTSSIRNDLLFQSLLDNWSDIITIVNAILGFLRDMELGQETGPLMYLVLKKKLGLQRAFDEIYSQLQDAFKDYKLCSEKLRQVYDNDGNVAQFIEIMSYILDGFLNGYQGAKRYKLQGKLKIESKVFAS